MNNGNRNDWSRPNHHDNVLNGALIVVIKAGLLLAMLQGSVALEAPPAQSAALVLSEASA